MSYEVLALIVLACWLLTGVALSVVMGRRGYDSFGWAILGAVLGPLAVVIAFTARRRTFDSATVLTRGIRGDGPIDVLVGHDGSTHADDAARTAIELVGSRLGRLTLARVVPFDAATEAVREATSALARAAESYAPLLGSVTPGVTLLRGRPADALQQYALEQSYELVAVGSRGTGGSTAVLGSAAGALARHNDVPVLLGAPQVARRRGRVGAATANA